MDPEGSVKAEDATTVEPGALEAAFPSLASQGTSTLFPYEDVPKLSVCNSEVSCV